MWSRTGWPTDQLPEAQPLGVQLRSRRTQTWVLHWWRYPPWSQRNRNSHVSFPAVHTQDIFTEIYIYLFPPFLQFPSLVCAVSYTTQYGEKLYFRKFFKFQVSCIPSALVRRQRSSSRVILEETWEMSQAHNRANAITIQAMDLVSGGPQCVN